MKLRKILSALIAVMLLFTCTAGAKTLELTIGSSSLYVSDGTVTESELDSPAYIAEGRTMVPVRVISENFGAEVLWDAATQTVTIKSSDTEIKLIINSNIATVNGTEYIIDAAPVISNTGRTMVPIRFISEMLGRNVEYIAPTAQILISDEKPIAEIAGRPLTIDDYRFLQIYLQVPAYDPVSAISYINSFAEEVLLLANEAKAKGVEINPEIAQELIYEITSASEIVYSKTLMASAVKFVIDYAHALTYVNSLDFASGLGGSNIEKYYKENYVRAKHVLILTSDEETGEPFNAEKKAIAKETAEFVLKRAKEGDDFDTLINKYGQDPGTEQMPDGYVFTKGEMVAPFETAAFALKIGEISPIVETDYGYHIIKRLALPEIDEATSYSIAQMISGGEYQAFYEGIRSKSTINYAYTPEQISSLLSK